MNNEEKILELLMRHEGSFEKINQTLTEIKTDVSGLKEDVSGLKEDVSGLKEDVSGLKAKLEEVDHRSIRTQLLLEGEYSQKLQLLCEGHTTILETMAPKSRVDALEEDVGFMKTVIKALSREVSELKKAQ